MISSLIFRGKWSIALIYYTALLGAFFVTPVSWQLPFWGMWDVYLAFICLLITSVMVKKWKTLWNTWSSSRLIYILTLSTFIGLEAGGCAFPYFYSYTMPNIPAVLQLGCKRPTRYMGFGRCGNIN